MSEIDCKDQNLIITRILGHKVDIKGSGQWKFFTEKVNGENDCWICDR